MSTAAPGRPPTHSGYLSLRLDPADKAAFVAAARSVGLSPGGYLVDLLRQDLARAGKLLRRRRLEVGVEDRPKKARRR